MRYTDPTGHMVDNGCRTEGCSAEEGEEHRDYIYNVVFGDRVRKKQEMKKDVIDLVVPDEGTKGFGVSTTVGAVIYVTGSFGAHIDSHGNVALPSPSIGGGGLLPAAVELSLFGSATNADTVYQLEGWSMSIGGSYEGGGSVGYEGNFFKDPSTGQKLSGSTVTLGLGAASPIPFEGHGGVNYAWIPLTFNLYDVFGLPRP